MNRNNLEKICRLTRFVFKPHWSDQVLIAKLRHYLWIQIDNRRKIQGLDMMREFYRSILLNLDKIIETGNLTYIEYIECGEKIDT